MFKKILVPVEIDYPDIAGRVVERVRAIAELSGAEIHLVTVMPGFSMPIVASLVPAEVRQAATDRVNEAMAQFITDYCDANVTYTIRVGKNWEEIVEVADEWGADLIIVYHNRHRDVNEVFSRSCSQRVAENANCSVLRLRNVLSK